MKPELAQKILQEVKDGYKAIASGFDQTRQELWPEFPAFKKYAKAGDKILDLGCGNGRLRLLFKDVKLEYIGVDNAEEFIKLAQSNQEMKLEDQKFIVAEMFNLPFVDNSFDVIYCIATFHHLPGKELRLKVLAEMKRVLKPAGRLVMTNWNRWQGEYLHYIIKYTGLKIISRNKMDFKDVLIPWRKSGFKRYYHAFTLGELKKLIHQSGLKLEKNFLTYRKPPKLGYLTAANIVTIAEK